MCFYGCALFGESPGSSESVVVAVFCRRGPVRFRWQERVVREGRDLGLIRWQGEAATPLFFGHAVMAEGRGLSEKVVAADDRHPPSSFGLWPDNQRHGGTVLDTTEC